MSKYVNDVRSTSSDSRYMGAPFQGAIAEAIAQAKSAPDHGLPPRIAGAPKSMSRDRAAILQFLGLFRKPSRYLVAHVRAEGLYVSKQSGVARLGLYGSREMAQRFNRVDAERAARDLHILGIGPFVIERA